MASNSPAAILREVKRAIREPYVWPGGYPLYVVLADGAALSMAAARAEWKQITRATLQRSRDGWCAAGTQVNWEDGALICDHTGLRIESAYAEPEDGKPPYTDAR